MDSRMMQRVLPIALTGLLSLGSSLCLADSLSGIYELALRNDATLKAAEATYRANLETENIARSALLPQVSGSAELQRKDIDQRTARILDLNIGMNSTLVDNFSDDSTESDTRTLTISLDQKIFDLPAWFSFKSGKYTSEEARAQFAADQQNVIVRVAEAYFNVLRAHENLEASLAEERAAKRQLEQTQQRFDVGLIAITDVHEARAVYDNTVAQRLSFEATLGAAYEAISVLTGQPHLSISKLDDDFPVTTPQPENRQTWVDFSLQNNHLLKAAMFRMQAAQLQAKSKKSGHLPKLSGSIAYNDFDEDGDSKSNINNAVKPFETQSDGSTISLRLSVPIYSGGGVSASRRQAYEQYNAALQQKISTQRQVVQQTRSLHLTVSTDVQRINARKQNIVSAQSALDATTAGYEVGTRNIVDVLQSQRSLFAAIRDYANTRFDYVINMFKLKQQAGTLSPDDIYNLDKWLIAEQTKKQE